MARALAIFLACFSVCNCNLCPNGWTKFHKSCYAYVGQHLPWVNAVSVCMSFGAKLVEITSARENYFIQSLLNNRHVRKAWLGINNLAENGGWQLTSEGRPLTYHNWDIGQPDSRHREQACAAIYSSNGKWDDDYCALSSTLPFVCQKF